MTAALALVVEDDERVLASLRPALTENGFRVVEARTARDAVAQTQGSRGPTIVLLDLDSQKADGIAVTKRLRKRSTVPIIVLSARRHERDKIAALDAGADDYITKPVAVGELLARMRSLIRRSLVRGVAMAKVVEVAGVRIDMQKRLVTRDGEEVHLKPTEYNVLTLLAKNADKVMTYDEILTEVWGPSAAKRSHYVRVQMAELRRKLERKPARPAFLINEPGIGYRLRA